MSTIRTCHVPECAHTNLSNHKLFRTESPTIRKTWIDAITQVYGNISLPKIVYICQCHFEPKSISTVNNEIRLDPPASIPTLFTPVIDSLRKKNHQLEKQLKEAKEELASLKQLLSKHFTNDEIRLMKGEHVPRFSHDTIVKALDIRCNTSHLGYQRYRARYSFLPSLRTVQNQLQPLDFDEGIMFAVMQSLGPISQTLFDEGKKEFLHCILLVDEMSIDGRVMFDPSYKKITGLVSDDFVPSHIQEKGVTANKVLVFMLKSMFANKTQAVSWWFTHALTKDMMLKSFIRVVKAIETQTKFLIHGLGSDQGSANEALWKMADGSSITHPTHDSRRLFFIPDISHLLKNLWNSLVTTDLILSKESCIRISEHLHLPLIEPVVSSPQSLDFFINLQELNKEVPHPVSKLTKSLLHSKDNYAKMRVFPTEVIFSHEVANAIVSASQKFGSPSEITHCQTMAAFLHIMADFRIICTHTGRDQDLVFTPKHYKLFDLVSSVFDGMKFIRSGKELKSQQLPKYPSGIKRLTACAKDLHDYMVLNHKSPGLPLGHLSTDFIENFFSRIKAGVGNPTPVQFPIRMQAVTLRSTEKIVSSKQNAPVKDSTSYIPPQAILSSSKAAPKPKTSFFVAVDEPSNKPQYHAIIVEMSELMINDLSSCASCKELFIREPDYLRQFKDLFVRILNTIEINLPVLKESFSLVDFIPMLVESCDLEKIPFTHKCHSLEDFVLIFIKFYLHKIQFNYDKSTNVFASKSAKVKQIGSHK